MVAIATGAGEKRAIAMTELGASGAGLAGMMRVNKGNSYAFSQGLILNELLKLREGPGLVDISLLLPHLNPRPDVLEVFHHGYSIRCGALNYALADGVVNLADYPAFPARQPFQEPCSSFSAFGLKRSPQIRKMPPYMHCLVTRKPEAIGSSGDIVDAKVYPDGVGSFRSGDWLRQSYIDIVSLLSGILSRQLRNYFEANPR